MSSHQDPRAWDAWVWGFIEDSPFRHGLPAEAETRLADAQGQLRRIGLKMRDGSVEHMLLVIADTPANRRAAAVAESIWSGMFPISARSALAALAHGHHPGGSALVFL